MKELSFAQSIIYLAYPYLQMLKFLGYFIKKKKSRSPGTTQSLTYYFSIKVSDISTSNNIDMNILLGLSSFKSSNVMRYYPILY